MKIHEKLYLCMKIMFKHKKFKYFIFFRLLIKLIDFDNESQTLVSYLKITSLRREIYVVYKSHLYSHFQTYETHVSENDATSLGG